MNIFVYQTFLRFQSSPPLTGMSPSRVDPQKQCSLYACPIPIQPPHILWLLAFTSSVCMLSCFSRVQLFATLWTVAHQAPLSLGFSRQEYWSGLPFPSPTLFITGAIFILKCPSSLLAYLWIGQAQETIDIQTLDWVRYTYMLFINSFIHVHLSNC